MKQSKSDLAEDFDPPAYTSRLYCLQFLDSDKIKWDGRDISDGIHQKLQSKDYFQDLDNSRFGTYIYKIKGNPFLGDDELGMYVIIDLVHYLFNTGFKINAFGKLKFSPLEKDTMYFGEFTGKGKFIGLQFNSNCLKVVNNLDCNFHMPIRKEYNRIQEYKVKEDNFNQILYRLKENGYEFYTAITINGVEIDADYWLFVKNLQ